MLPFSGLSLLRLSDISWPAAEKDLSDGTEVPAIDRYFSAIFESTGNWMMCDFHQRRRFFVCRYSRSSIVWSTKLVLAVVFSITLVSKDFHSSEAGATEESASSSTEQDLGTRFISASKRC